MIKKSIPDVDLKLLIDFLRVAIKPDLEFQAVYESVMASFTVQNRLFRALTERKRSFVDVVVKRKKRQILLDFSVLPDSVLSDALAEAAEKKKVIAAALPVADTVRPLIAESAEIIEPVTDFNSAVVPVVSLHQNSEPDVLLDVPMDKKRKTRGKAKKPTVSRSPVTVLIDDSDIELLNEMGLREDMNISQLIRLAVKRLLPRAAPKL